MYLKKLLTVAAVAVGMSAVSVSAATIDLGFAIDESGSVNGSPTTGELGTIRRGLADALDVIPSVGATGNPNTYRISIVRFASGSSVLVPPTVIDDTTRAAIQNTLLTTPRISGGTNIPSAVTALTNALCPGGTCAADTTLFNIATDGAGGNPATSGANAAAQAAGVDGISYEAIGGGAPASLIQTFAFPQPAVIVSDPNNLPNPLTTGFVLQVASFDDFADAVRLKVGRIVTDTGGGGGGGNPVPLPASLPLLLAGLGVVGVMRRRARG